MMRRRQRRLRPPWSLPHKTPQRIPGNPENPGALERAGKSHPISEVTTHFNSPAAARRVAECGAAARQHIGAAAQQRIRSEERSGARQDRTERGKGESAYCHIRREVQSHRLAWRSAGGAAVRRARSEGRVQAARRTYRVGR